MDDRELNRLLREWTAPDAPPDLRPRRARASRLALVGHRDDSRARAGCARRAVAGRVVGRRWPRPGPSCRRPRRPAPRRSGELARYALTGASPGVRRGARGAELPARRVSPGASSSRSHRRLRRGWADAVRHQPRAGSDRAGGRHVLRTAGALHTAFGSASPMRPCASWRSWWSPTAAR